MDLILFGTSYKVSPVEIRERISLSEQEILDFIPQIKEVSGIFECMALSTCNRTEIYAICEDNFDVNLIADLLTKYKEVEPDLVRNNFYTFKSTDTARHLFNVSSGIESQMLGENQVLGQVKDAYSIARIAKSTGPFLNKLLHMAFRVGKDVRTKTNLGVGAVSISSAAAQLASYIFETLVGKTTLLIGAGETGELVAKHLLERGVSSIKIANRTKANAQKLAEVYRAEVVDFERIAEHFFENDIVVSATAGNEYILTDEMLKNIVRKNPSKKTVAIDIAIPRDIDPKIANYENVFVYDIDDLKTVVDKNMEERRNEIPEAEKIILEAVADYEKWRREQRVVPTIKYLQNTFEDIRQAELSKSKHCRDCHKRTEMDDITRRIINKILNAPITKLVKDTNCSEAELEYLRNIFSKKE